MGGSGAALDAALAYSDIVFAGAVLVWLFNSLSALIRGTGNMHLPAIVACAGVALLIPLSAWLIFGGYGVPALGIRGGALALLIYYLGGSAVLLAYLMSRHSLLQPGWRGIRWRWPLFRDILRVGLAGSVSTVATNLTIAVTVALVGSFGAAAIAGYGTASRLEYLLVPLVFGLGAPLVAMVGTCIGAGERERALRAKAEAGDVVAERRHLQRVFRTAHARTGDRVDPDQFRALLDRAGLETSDFGLGTPRFALGGLKKSAATTR
jgi:Na+-driven multidrug efflux pump